MTVADVAVVPNETTALLSQPQKQAEAFTESGRFLHNYRQDKAADQSKDPPSYSILPIPFLAAIAIAATAATQIYAYASLLCSDPRHCEDAEQHSFAGAVAAATFMANVCAMLALGIFEKLARRRHKAGLAVWLIVRSMSIGALTLGIAQRSIIVALCSQVFEGFASDNILHFNLNAMYVQVSNRRSVSRLIGSSLALYMIGISISPSIASLLPSFQASFVMASMAFAIAFLYLMFGLQIYRVADVVAGGTVPSSSTTRSASMRHLTEYLRTVLSPLLFFSTRPWSLLVGLSLFLYNCIQSYTFSAIMVHTSVNVGFTSRENGFLMSIAHAVASAYLLGTLFAVPYLVSFSHSSRRSKARSNQTGSTDAGFALVSLFLQALSLTLFGFVREAWEVYTVTALLAIGLATPSFIKSYFVTLFPSSDGPKAVAGLAMMETLGSLFAPVLLGGLQTVWPGNRVFFVAAAGIATAFILFLLNVIIVQQRRGKQNQA